MNIFKKNIIRKKAARSTAKQDAISNLRVIFPLLAKVHIHQIATYVGKKTAALLYDSKDESGFIELR